MKTQPQACICAAALLSLFLSPEPDFQQNKPGALKVVVEFKSVVKHDFGRDGCGKISLHGNVTRCVDLPLLVCACCLQLCGGPGASACSEQLW